MKHFNHLAILMVWLVLILSGCEDKAVGRDCVCYDDGDAMAADVLDLYADIQAGTATTDGMRLGLRDLVGRVIDWTGCAGGIDCPCYDEGDELASDILYINSTMTHVPDATELEGNVKVLVGPATAWRNCVDSI